MQLNTTLAKLNQDFFTTFTCEYLHVKMVKTITSHFKVYDGHDRGQVSQLTLDDIPISASYKLTTFSLTQQSKTLSMFMNLGFLNYFFRNFCWHNLVYSSISLGC